LILKEGITLYTCSLTHFHALDYGVEFRNEKKKMKKIVFFSMFIFLSACGTKWENPSGNSSKLNQDIRYCKSVARAAAPIYICRNPLMCAPDETNRVINSLSSHRGYFDKCMFEQGNKSQ
jgi:hypothetical protein